MRRSLAVAAGCAVALSLSAAISAPVLAAGAKSCAALKSIDPDNDASIDMAEAKAGGYRSIQNLKAMWGQAPGWPAGKPPSGAEHACSSSLRYLL